VTPQQKHKQFNFDIFFRLVSLYSCISLNLVGLEATKDSSSALIITILMQCKGELKKYSAKEYAFVERLLFSMVRFKREIHNLD